MNKHFEIYAFADEADAMIDGQIAAMKRNGLLGLEIRNVDGENISTISAAKAREVREKMDAAGLKIWSLGSPFGKIGITGDFGPHLELFKRGIENAHILGTEKIRMFSFYMPPQEDPAIYHDAVLERLSRFLEAAEGSGIPLPRKRKGHLRRHCCTLPGYPPGPAPAAGRVRSRQFHSVRPEHPGSP